MKLHGGTICSLCPVPGAGDRIWAKLLPWEPVEDAPVIRQWRGSLEMTLCDCRQVPAALILEGTLN